MAMTSPVNGTTLDPKARRREQRGWYFYDWANSAFSTTVAALFLGPYLTEVAKSAAGAGEQIKILWLIPVSAESYFPFIVSLSVLLQIILMPILGSVADVVRSKKTVLGVLAYTGALATMALYFVSGSNYQLGGVLFLIANVAFGAAFAVNNSYLPQIAEPDERNRVSSVAWAMGYVGGGILLVLNLGFYLQAESLGVSQSMAVRISLFSAGLWWAVFTIIPLIRLRNRPPIHPATTNVLSSGFRQLGHTLSSLRDYPQALLFLVAFFFFNDGIQTAISMSAVYATEELDLSLDGAVIPALVLVQAIGIVGALVLGRLARRYTAKNVVLFSLVLWTVVLIFGFFTPAGRPLMFFILAALIGFVLGGSQALSRALFAQLVPKYREAEYFSLYEVSNGASSVLGPLVFGLTLLLTDSYRYALLFLIVFFVIGGILLTRVNVAKGVAQVNASAAP